MTSYYIEGSDEGTRQTAINITSELQWAATKCPFALAPTILLLHASISAGRSGLPRQAHPRHVERQTWNKLVSRRWTSNYPPGIQGLFRRAIEIGLGTFRSDKLAVPEGKKTRTKQRSPDDARRAPHRSREIPVDRVVASPRLKSTYHKNHIIFETSSKPGVDFGEPDLCPKKFGFNKMRSYVQFVTTPTVDTPGTTLLLHFDQKRYLLGNVAEGTQRATVERGMKLLKVTDIFLTGPIRWSTTGGLIGMILTLADITQSAKLSAMAAETVKAAAKAEKERRSADAQQPGTGKEGVEPVTGEPSRHVKVEDEATLTVHGARNLAHLLATSRRFVLRKGMPLRVHEIGEDEVHERPQEQPRPAKRSSRNELQDVRGTDEDSISAPRNVCLPTWKDENIMVWAMSISPHEFRGSPSAHNTRRSSRKRSYSEAETGDLLASGVEPTLDESPTERRERENQMRKAVVSEMFDSSWRLDTLVEMPLSKVSLPATVFVRDPETKQIQRYVGPLPSQETDGNARALVPDIQVLVRQPWPAALIESLPSTSPSEQSVCYIIKNHPQRGKFLPDQALALKVQKGFKWSALAKGNNVEAADGKIVTPDMVIARGKIGGGIAVVELPSTAYVRNLINRQEWRIEEVMAGVGVIVWILGPGVSQDEDLTNFMKSMSHLRHLISSPDDCPNYLAFESAATSAIQWHQLDPERFSIPVFNNDPPLVSKSSLTTTDRENQAMFANAERGMVVQLEPSMEVQKTSVPFLDTSSVQKEMPRDVLRLAEDARKLWNSPDMKNKLEAKQTDLPGKDAEIITLGTGSMVPSKHRNVSATLLRVPGHGSYLFDCGENTLGQLRRMFSPEELAEILRDLKAIWISHLHADHHLGTVSVIKAWYEEVWGSKSSHGIARFPNRPSMDLAELLRAGNQLLVISDHGMIKWLEEYAGVEDYGYAKIVPLSVIPVDLSRGGPMSTKLQWNKDTRIGFGAPDEKKPVNEALKQTTGLVSIQAARVSHCHGAYAVSYTFSDGFKFSYSGDCRPSRAFGLIGRGSTVLVHEATFDDELRGDALAKKHSCTSEALAVGIDMGARRVILTHFSQRYQKIPVMDGVEGIEPVLDEEEAESRTDEAATTETTMAKDLDGVATGGPAAGTTQGTVEEGKGGVVKIRPSSSSDMKVGVAFDYMRVKVGEIAYLEHLTPALLKLFGKGDDG